MQIKVAIIQLNARDSLQENLGHVERALEQAGAMGPDLVALPEYWTYFGPYEGFDSVAQSISGSAIALLQEQARKHRMIVHGGSIVERHPSLQDKFYNTSVLINRDGEIVAQYRKIHLFDVTLSSGEKHHESERIVSGSEVVTAEVEGITFGLSICYDLRFPELYRSLALQEAQILLVPAGFTLHTGRDHWEVLLRARAIENLCYVIAPAQVGMHPPNNYCYGRSMIVDPWGLILAQAQDKPTILLAEIDLDEIGCMRSQIPCLEHRRPQTYHV